MTASKTHFNWGIVGPGRIATNFAKDLPHVAGAVMHSVYGRTLSKAEAFAKTHGFAHVHDDLAQFLADPELDIVYIATVHPAHFEQAAQAIEAGKPLLIEKPVTMTADEARKLDALSEKHNVFVMEALWSRFLPPIVRAKEIVDSGVLGKIERGEASFNVVRAFDAEDRLFNPELGGGAMHDLGVYPLSVMQYLLGPLTLKQAQWQAAPTGVDHRAKLELTAGSTQIRASAGFEDNAENEGDNHLVLYGSKGTLRINPRFHEAKSLTLWDQPLEDVSTYAALPEGKTERFDRDNVGLNYQAVAVQKALSEGLRQHPAISLAESAQILDLIEAVIDPKNRV